MTATTPDLSYVALASVNGIGPRRIKSLTDAFGDAGAAIAAPWHQLLAVPGISRAAATAIRNASVSDARRAVERTRAFGGEVLTLEGSDSRFPSLLRVIPDPPPVLYVVGDITLLESDSVAIVGSRDHTDYGHDVCRALSGRLAEAGLTIVSGMARGIDAAAHAAALQTGRTVGVLGNGLGVVYPAANRALYGQVQAGGALLTEFPPGERPTAGSFPRRNRLISGLARMTVVVEARARSGALITADCALNQGREVGAVPGPVTSPMSEGCNRLIADGAKPILTAEDVMEEFGISARARRAVRVPEGTGPLVNELRRGPGHVDQLAFRLDLTAGETLAFLTTLEIEGLVARGPGKIYRLAVR